MIIGLKNLTLKDKPLFDKFINLSPHELAAYNFANIYIWRSLFDIRWQLIGDNLCLFFRDKLGCFLYLAPLGKKINLRAAQEAFLIMDKFNRNKNISRIENVEEKDAAIYRQSSYCVRDKFCDYLCSRARLSGLRGNKFKSQRAAYNYFSKHNRFEYLPFSLEDKQDCLKLYARWMQVRKAVNKDEVYDWMLEDSSKSLRTMLDAYKELGVTGRVVKIDGQIMAFTFGFKLNPDTFCILYEITDLSVKGLAQFVFRTFCQELKNYAYINIMDDSGLKNLKTVKLSYRPVKLVPNFIVSREDA